MKEAHKQTSGWRAALQLGFRAGKDRTVLAERRRKGPLAVQRPFYPEGDICHVYLLHPPGGVVGGDTLEIDVEVGRGARALVTTPGATKFYRSAGSVARQVQHVRVAAEAALEWLPQESIVFRGAKARLETRIELQAGSRLALWEILCLGRPVIDEHFDSGHFDGHLMVSRDGRPLLDDRLRVGAGNRSRLSQMAGHAVSGILLIAPAGDRALLACRELLQSAGKGHTGATMIEEMLVVRYLGDSTEVARDLFIKIWKALRADTLGQAPCVPRIWAT